MQEDKKWVRKLWANVRYYDFADNNVGNVALPDKLDKIG